MTDMERNNIRGRYSQWVLSYYIFAILFEFIHVYIDGLRYGVICSILLMVIWGIVLLKGQLNKNTKSDFFVAAYIGYSLLSLVLLFFNNNYSLSVGIGEIATGILPIVFFWIGKNCNKDGEKIFFQRFCLAVCFLLVVGYYFFFFNPEIYFRYLENNSYAFFRVTYKESPRMEAFVGSSAVGYMATVLFMLCVHNISVKKIKNNGKAFIIGVFALGAVVLSLQRVAWACCILILIAYVALSSKNKGKVVLISIVLCLGICVFIGTNDSIRAMVFGRLEGSENIFTERSGPWKKVFQQEPIGLLIGNGIGIAGHRATADYSIHDGSYFKILYEVGIVGFILFISIVIHSIFKGCYFLFKKKETNYLTYLAIICITCVHAIGSNAFTFQLYQPIFWYSIGRCNLGREGR